MTTRRAESAAAALLSEYGGRNDERAVDPRQIAKSLGVVVVETQMENALSGMLVREGDNVVIGVNRHHMLVRKRFTIAHELGHLRLHRGRALIVDSTVRLDFRDPESAAATNREEIEANAFAAALLMPEDRVTSRATALALDDAGELTRRLAAHFNVSKQAMGFRLINLGLIDPD